MNRVRIPFKLAFILASIALPAMGQLNVRDITLTNDVRTAGRSRGAIEWWQGESVRYTERAVRDGASVDLTDATSVRWDVVDRAPATPSSYIAVTGTVVSATNGIVRFTLTPAEANLPEGTYLGTVKAYQSTNYLGVLAEREIRVRYTPDSTNYAVVGPLTNLILHPDTTTIQAPTGFPFLIRAGDDGSNLTNLNVEAAVETFLDENPDTISDAIGGTTITWTSAPLTVLHFDIEDEYVTSVTNSGVSVSTSLVEGVTWVEVGTDIVREVRSFVSVPYRDSFAGRTQTYTYGSASVASFDSATGLATQALAGAWALTNTVTGGGETVVRHKAYAWEGNYLGGGTSYILAFPQGTIASQSLVHIDAGIDGAGSSIDLISTWKTAISATNGSQYAWNSSLWLDGKRFAFQSVADARSPGAIGYNYGPFVLISDDVALTIQHSSSGGWPGDWVNFVDTNGVSQITYIQSVFNFPNGLGTALNDVRVALLDPPPPASVPRASLLDTTTKIANLPGAPTAYIDGNLHLYLGKGINGDASRTSYSLLPFDKAERAAKYSSLEHGGSSYFVLPNAMILIGFHGSTGASCPNYLPAGWATLTNAIGSAGGDIPTAFDVSGYDDE